MNSDHKQIHTLGADILRACAILMVVIYHACWPVYTGLFAWSGWVRDVASPSNRAFLWVYPITLGWAGVALFFVLSGFCIHFSFLRSARLDPRRFFWRRFWRIYPAYGVALLVFMAVQHVNVLSRYGAVQFVSHALFLQNFRESTFFGINPSFWSIATEVQLYLLFPALLFLRARFGMGRALAGIFALGCLWRLAAVSFWALPEHLISPALTSPLSTWFDWALGAFVAERFSQGRPAFGRRWVWLGVLVPLFVASTLFKPATVFSFSVAAAASAVVLDAALRVRWRRNVWVSSFAFLGVISYSVYLWHQPLLIPVTGSLARLPGSWPAAWIVFLALLATGAWISFRLLEQVGIRAGDTLWNRLKQKPSPGGAGVPVPADG